MTGRYTARQASAVDYRQVAELWWPFIRARSEVDRSLRLKPGFDVPRFVERELQSASTFCWLAEHRTDSNTTANAVGCLIWYLDEEAVDPFSPFEPRRCGKVLGLYVAPPHRNSGCASLLMRCGLEQAESLGVTDIDVLVTAEQQGLHAMLERAGMSRVAVQFTRHYAADARLGSAAASSSNQVARASLLGHRFADQ